MLQILTQYNGRRKLVKVYQEWDIDGEEVVEFADCTAADKGKLARFTDGSGWFVRVLGCSDLAVKTEAGTFRKADVVQCSKIKWPGGNYSGVPSADEHPGVRPYTRREKAFATRLINGTLGDKKVTKRIRMLTMEKLSETAEKYGVDEDWVVSKFHEMAENTRGKHAFQAVVTLARMRGVELNQTTKDDGKRPMGLFQQNNFYAGTIQEARRREIPTKSDLKGMIPESVCEVAVVVDECIDAGGDRKTHA